MLYELCIFAMGLYVGKYHPQYVPIPKITKEHSDMVFQYLKDLQAKMGPQVQEEAEKNEIKKD